MTIKDQARAIVSAHYDAKGWTTRAAAFREGRIDCADDVDLVVSAIEAERRRCAGIADIHRGRWKNAGGFEGHTAAARIIGDVIRGNP